MKECISCHQVKPLKDFTKDARRVGGRTNDCKRCRSDYMLRRYAATRQWVDTLKDRPCADCGGRFPPEAMDFDHRPGEEKLFEVGDGVSQRSRAALAAEIEKCDLVCANCHRTRTRKRGLVEYPAALTGTRDWSDA